MDLQFIRDRIIAPIVACAMAPFVEHLGAVFFYTTYVRNMRTKLMRLNDVKNITEDEKKRYREKCLVVPDPVNKWLADVETTNGNVERVPHDAGHFLEFMKRYELAKKAMEITAEIERRMERHSEIKWTEDSVLLAEFGSTYASTSTSSVDQVVFPSRGQTYNKALEALGPNHSSHMVALYGMGGVGKTTLMKKLVKDVTGKFKYIVKVVIGENPDLMAIQDIVARYFEIDLKGKDTTTRAAEIRQKITARSDGGLNRFLIILDDVWHPIDLEDIGFSPLQDQGVNFKVLITSRDEAVCTRMNVGVKSVLKVELITEEEAQSLFYQCAENPNRSLKKIGDAIVRKCCRLPIAINTIGCSLRGTSWNAWNDALVRLQHHNNKTVTSAVFETSYVFLHDEEIQTTFLLCGLYPEDFDIPIEDLVRYGWGLKLFKEVYNIREARYRLNTCIQRLFSANLLTEGDMVGRVKMHDLVRSFVLNKFSTDEHASIVNHDRSGRWPEDDKNASCKRISFTCTDLPEFPKDLKFPNLSILKLMHGDVSLKFPEGFYGEMEKLQIISYDRMMCPLLPSPPHQYSTNIRVLRLHDCALANLSSIGNLSNLEVLSFAKSGIKSLPSTIQYLIKLRVLDVTGCGGLRIDNGFFKNLVKLEELYASRFDPTSRYSSENAISFTGANCDEVAERWKKLSTLEFEFFKNDAQWKNLSFDDLELFKISVGRSLEGEHFIAPKHLFGNTLKLESKKGEVLRYEINKLFEKTVVLCLRVDDMNVLKDVGVKPSSFLNLRVLVVSECAELKYLFTLSVAKDLSNLEHLQISNCRVIKEVIHIETGGEEIVTLPNLKFLSLSGLQELSGLCQNVNPILLPKLVQLELKGIPNITSIYSKNRLATSCLLREVLVSKLEKLYIEDMKNLKEIWPCNPLPLLLHLEQLVVKGCDSIEALFNIDLDCVGEIEEEECRSSLRMIVVRGLGKLREVWKIKGGENNSRPPIRGFQAVENIEIYDCERFRYLFSPTTINFDLGALTHLDISDCGKIERNNGLVETSQEQEIITLPEEETSEASDNISYILFPPSVVHSFNNLRWLKLKRDQTVEVVFEIGSTLRGQDNQQQILPNLQELNIRRMVRMSHVWKCNWNKFLILQNQPSELRFHNLTNITMYRCPSITYLFSPLMAELLSNLKTIWIQYCQSIEEVVSHRDDGDLKHTTSTSTHTTTLFPHLDSLSLYGLRNLDCYGGGGGCSKDGNNEISSNRTTATTASLDRINFCQGGGVSWTLCQYPREIRLTFCFALSSGIPWYAAGKMQKLEVLYLADCDRMKEVFETRGINNSVTMLELANLKILKIQDCNLLEHIFTYSTLETLGKLEELTLGRCKAIQVIVVQEEDQTRKASSSKTPVVVFPCLKTIRLIDLPEVVGFFSGTNIEFQWPLLDDLIIADCPRMKVFTAGRPTAPKLKYVQTRMGKHSTGHWSNTHMSVTTTTTALHDQESTSSSCPAATSQWINSWSFHNLIELHGNDKKIIIPSNELLHLQNLEKIHLKDWYKVEEVFEALEGTNNTGFDESPTTVVELPKLRQVELDCVDNLRYIWKSNRWTLFKFPCLTTVSINYCQRLQHVFTSSMVGSLKQLQQLSITDCYQMVEVIVRDANTVVKDESDGKMNEIVLPCLKTLELSGLQSLKGFCLGKVDFLFKSLDNLIIKSCPAITTFTTGRSSTPELKEIIKAHSRFHEVEDINSLIKMAPEEFKSR